MGVRIHDPGHLALRRGIRAAVALPLSLATTLYLVDDAAGALFAIFGTVGLLINADFAGSTRQRLASYLVTGAAGAVALSIGWAASFSTPVATLVTFAVVFALSFVNLLRGAIAVGTPAVVLVFVVSVCLEGTADSLLPYLVGWAIAVVISTATALTILPRDNRADQREALAAAFAAAARGADRAWLHPDPTATDPFVGLGDAVERLDREYGGQPFRTAGLTTRDQAMTLLVDHANSARLLLVASGPALIADGALPLPERDDLVRAIVAGLDDLAAAMRDPHHLPSGADLDAARVRLTEGLERWVLAESESGRTPQELASQLGRDHLMRMSALLVEQMVELARLVNGGRAESLERQPPVPVRRRSTILRSQFSWDSPWLRTSLRSATGLSLAVLVVNLTGVQHGFWVLIGVISILRFDAVGTRKFAVQAIVGTLVGVLIASVIVLNVHSATVLWILLPLFVFIAAWSAVALNYPIGQASFSILILVAFGIVAWPPDGYIAVVRVEDVALGAAVALVVGLLMWPRGAVGHLRQQLATAIRSASRYLSEAMASFVDPSLADEVARQRHVAARDAERAAETYDLALMQRGPAEDMSPWTRATTAVYLLISASRVVAHFAATTPVLREEGGLQGAVEAARRTSDAHWALVADAVDDSPTIPCPSPADDREDVPVVAQIRDLDDARALIVTVWVVDWVRHLDRISARRDPSARVLA